MSRSAVSGLLAVAATAALVAGLLAVEPVRAAVDAALHGDLDGLRRQVRELGAGAALVLVGLALVHVVVPFPAELPTAAAGFAYGAVLGFGLMLGAWVLSGLVAYGLARAAGRPVLERVLGSSRLRRAEAAVARGGAGALVGVRLIPLLPFSPICFACGVARVPLGRYTWTTAVGTAPLTALVALLGARLQTPDLGDPVLWALVAGLVALVVLAPRVARRLGARRDAAER